MAELSESSFRVGGLVSGLNTSDIIKEYMAIERKPVDRLEFKKSGVEKKLVAWRDLNTRILALKVKSGWLKSESTFQGRNASSSNTDVLTVTGLAGDSTSAQTITVKALSQNHQIASQVYSTESANIGMGTVSIKVGSLSYEDITVDENNNTLEGLRDTINNGSYGVTASIVQTDDSSFRLIFNSKTDGENGNIVATMDLSGGTTPAFSTIQDAQDAHITLGSGASAIDIYRSKNSFSDVIDGLVINLKSIDENNPVTVSLTRDSSKVRDTIDGFIEQFNNLVDYFDQQLDYDPDSGKTGTLFSESSLITIQRDLYDLVTNSTGGSGEYKSISQLGIGVGPGGRLEIQDETLLTDALSDNLEDVAALFGDEDNGIAVRVYDHLDNMLDPEEGILATVEEQYLSDIDDINNSIALKEEYLSRAETQYYKKFTDLEVSLAKLQTQSNYLNYQIEAMRGGGNGATDFSQ